MPDGREHDEAAPGRVPWGNDLLDALASAVTGTAYERMVQEALEAAEVDLDEVVHAAGAMVEDVWFPTSSVLGLLSVVSGVASVEAMPVGPEGLVGLAAVLGDGRARTRPGARSRARPSACRLRSCASCTTTSRASALCLGGTRR